MPDHHYEPGMTCWLTTTVYDNELLLKCLENRKTRVVQVVEAAGEDEEWGDKWKIVTRLGTTIASQQDLSPLPELVPDATQRGFGRLDFTDLYGSDCSVQESSLATEGAIWFGVNDGGHFNMKTPEDQWNQAVHGDRATGGRMHLSQGQAAALLPILEHFVKTGGLPDGKVMP